MGRRMVSPTTSSTSCHLNSILLWLSIVFLLSSISPPSSSTRTILAANALPSPVGESITVLTTMNYGPVQNDVWGGPRCADHEYVYTPQGQHFYKVAWDIPFVAALYPLPGLNHSFSMNCYTNSSIDYILVSSTFGGVFKLSKNFSEGTLEYVLQKMPTAVYPNTEKYMNFPLLSTGMILHVQEQHRFYITVQDGYTGVWGKMAFFDDFPPYRFGYLSGVNVFTPANASVPRSIFGPSYATKLAGVVALHYAANNLYLITGIDYYLAKISTGTGFSTMIYHLGFFQFYTNFQMVPLIGGTNCGYLVITGTQKTLLFNVETYERHYLLIPGVNVDNSIDNTNSNASYVLNRPSKPGSTQTQDQLRLLAWNPDREVITYVNMYGLNDIPLPTGCKLCNASDSDVRIPTEPLPPPQESCGADSITNFVPQLAFNRSDLTSDPAFVCADFDHYYMPKGDMLTKVAFDVPTPCEEHWDTHSSSYLPKFSFETGFHDLTSCFTNGNTESIFAVDLDRQAIYLINKTMWGAVVGSKKLIAGNASLVWNNKDKDDPIGTKATFVGPVSIDCMAANGTCYISDAYTGKIRTMSMSPPYGVGTLTDMDTPTNNGPTINIPRHLVAYEPLTLLFLNDMCVRGSSAEHYCLRKIDVHRPDLGFTTIYFPYSDHEPLVWYRFGLFHTSPDCADQKNSAFSGALFISTRPNANNNQTALVMTLDGLHTGVVSYPKLQPNGNDWDHQRSWYPGAYFERKNTSYGEQLYAVGGDQSPDRRIFQLRFASPQPFIAPTNATIAPPTTIAPETSAPPQSTSSIPPDTSPSSSGPEDHGPMSTELFIVIGVCLVVIVILVFVTLKVWMKRVSQRREEEASQGRSIDPRDIDDDDESLRSKSRARSMCSSPVVGPASTMDYPEQDSVPPTVDLFGPADLGTLQTMNTIHLPAKSAAPGGASRSSISATSGTTQSSFGMKRNISVNSCDGFDSGSSKSSVMNAENITFKKGKVIGSGGFGRVYLGMDATTGMLLAAKEIAFNVRDPDVEKKLTSLRREIAFMKRLDHRNIVKYLGGDRAVPTPGSQKADRYGDSRFYILMEFVPGGSLWDAMQAYRGRGAFPANLVRHFTSEIAHGLHYLHSKGVVHRDLKSLNVLIGVDGTPKIADFGSAGNVETVTTGGGINGTAFWMAPEVIRQERYTVKSDVWSLGCIVMELMTKRLPWAHALEKELCEGDKNDQDNAEGVVTHDSIGSEADNKHVGHRGARVMVMIMSATDEWVDANLPKRLDKYPILKTFVQACLRVKAEDRPTMEELMKFELFKSVAAMACGSTTAPETSKNGEDLDATTKNGGESTGEATSTSSEATAAEENDDDIGSGSDADEDIVAGDGCQIPGPPSVNMLPPPRRGKRARNPNGATRSKTSRGTRSSPCVDEEVLVRMALQPFQNELRDALSHSTAATMSFSCGVDSPVIQSRRRGSGVGGRVPAAAGSSNNRALYSSSQYREEDSLASPLLSHDIHGDFDREHAAEKDNVDDESVFPAPPTPAAAIDAASKRILELRDESLAIERGKTKKATRSTSHGDGIGGHVAITVNHSINNDASDTSAIASTGGEEARKTRAAVTPATRTEEVKTEDRSRGVALGRRVEHVVRQLAIGNIDDCETVEVGQAPL